MKCWRTAPRQGDHCVQGALCSCSDCRLCACVNVDIYVDRSEGVKRGFLFLKSILSSLTTQQTELQKGTLLACSLTCLLCWSSCIKLQNVTNPSQSEQMPIPKQNHWFSPPVLLLGISFRGMRVPDHMHVATQHRCQFGPLSCRGIARSDRSGVKLALRASRPPLTRQQSRLDLKDSWTPQTPLAGL